LSERRKKILKGSCFKGRGMITPGTSMDQRPSLEANSNSAIQEILPLLWNRKFIAVFTRTVQKHA
jgi:hypothetical protein